MLEAKHVNVFSRTDTRPFFFTCHLGDKLGAEIQDSACNLQPTAIRPASEQYYRTDSKILSSPNCRHPFFAKILGTWQSSALRGRFSASNSFTSEGKETIKKCKAGNADSLKGSVGFPSLGGLYERVQHAWLAIRESTWCQRSLIRNKENGSAFARQMVLFEDSRSSRNSTRAFHTPERSRSSKYGLNTSSLLGGAERGPYSGANPAACMYLRIVLRSQPVNLLMAWMFAPCRCSSFSSCTSLPLNKFRNLLRVEWVPVYHVKGWGKFNRHYGDFCTGADILNPQMNHWR